MNKIEETQLGSHLRQEHRLSVPLLISLSRRPGRSLTYMSLCDSNDLVSTVSNLTWRDSCHKIVIQGGQRNIKVLILSNLILGNHRLVNNRIDCQSKRTILRNNWSFKRNNSNVGKICRKKDHPRSGRTIDRRRCRNSS